MTNFERRVLIPLFASAALAGPAWAQDAPAGAAPAPAPAPAVDNDLSGDIIVTAQKREQSLQDVPISIQALGTKKLDQLNISNFNEFSQQLPSVAFQSSQPGVTTVYMRGVASGGDGNHSGPLPSVGFYLDEQPITTIGGTPDVHVYDVARIESLAGPQGTLYGASSEAGTIRIITNKPDTAGFYGRIDGEVNSVHSGGIGGKIEGMLNTPFSDSAALRVVGFYQKDAGYIDNVFGRRDFIAPASGGGSGSEEATLPGGVSVAGPIARTDGGISVDNREFVKKDYNDTETWGGRAALKVDLDQNWTVTPTVLYQESRSHGSYGFDPRLGDLKVQHFFPEYRRDRFIQGALTIEGKLGNWDITYAGAYLDRKDFQSADYTDYAEAYDSLYAGSGGIAGYFYFNDNAGNLIDPRQRIVGSDHFKKLSQEFRVASPQDKPFRLVAGLFYQRQSNLIYQNYLVDGLADDLSVNGMPGTLWLTKQHRVDKDYAVFGEASLDILPKLTATAGARGFIYDNSLIGFFGFGRNPGNGYSDSPPNAAGSNRTGVAQCFTESLQRLYTRDTDTYADSRTLLPAAVAGSPCTNLAVVAGNRLEPVTASGQGITYRFNLTWKPKDGVLLYGTWSRGFRPGGINRRVDVAPYAADYLTNYEAGAKISPLAGLRLNAAVYQQDWKNFQFAFLGANSFTEIHNGPDARIRGIEADISYTPVVGLSFTAAGAYTDAKTRKSLCAYDDPTFSCTAPGPTGEVNYVSAPTGTHLPVTPRLKVNGTVRYEMPVAGAKVHVQGSVVHASSASADIRRVVQNVAIDEYNPAAVADPANYFVTATTTGRLPAYTTADFAIGADLATFSLEFFVQNAFDERAELSRFQECGQCFQRPYVVPVTPRTIGIRAGAKF